MAIGIAFGLITGAFLYCCYDFQSSEFYEDKHYFEVPEEEVVKPAAVSRKKLPPLDNTYKGS